MCSTEWENSITNFPKLRTYKKLKSEYKCETYVELNLTRAERSILAQFRCGLLPLRIETGRFVGEAEADRIYKMCKSSYVENERHFLLDWDLRIQLILNIDHSFEDISKDEQFKILICKYPRKTAKFLNKAFNKRNNFLWRNNKTWILICPLLNDYNNVKHFL